MTVKNVWDEPISVSNKTPYNNNRQKYSKYEYTSLLSVSSCGFVTQFVLVSGQEQVLTSSDLM